MMTLPRKVKRVDQKTLVQLNEYETDLYFLKVKANIFLKLIEC